MYLRMDTMNTYGCKFMQYVEKILQIGTYNLCVINHKTVEDNSLSEW